MKMFVNFLVFLLLATSVNAKIGYFWHISDIHYDVNYTAQRGDVNTMCWRGSDTSTVARRSAGQFGDYRCFSPWSLLQSAARAMRRLHADLDIEFVLWTGDAGSYSGMDAEQILNAIQNVTHLLRHTFSSQFVFPVLGHSDVTTDHVDITAQEMCARVAAMWSVWLPTEALTSFQKGGYYTIEQKERKLRLIALNTNLYARRGASHARLRHPEAAASSLPGADEDPAGQWAWLEAVLEKSRRNRETVYIVGHAPPGVDETLGNSGSDHGGWFQDRHNRRYLQIVRKYSSIIVGQFFGHLHSDTFRVMYNEQGDAISWCLMSPSVSPWRPASHSNNPALRLYKFDTLTGQVLDYTQFYLDLNTANQRGRAEWTPEYNFTTRYALSEISAKSLHALAESFRDSTLQDDVMFSRYISAYSVSLQSSSTTSSSSSNSRSVVTSTAAATECGRACQQLHYCAITRMDYSHFTHCIANNELVSSSADYNYFHIMFLLCLLVISMLNIATR